MKKAVWIKFGLLLFLIAIFGFALRTFDVDVSHLSPEKVRSFVLSFGIWAPAIYLIAYGQPLVWVPASVMMITSGLAFGPLWGTLAALSGGMLRACSQFLMARFLGREAIAKFLRGGMVSLDRKIGAQGFKAVILVRLIPNVPFDIQNFGFGFSKVRFGHYAIATFLGMIPACFAFVYFGHSLTTANKTAKLLLAIVLLISLAIATSIWRKRHPASIAGKA